MDKLQTLISLCKCGVFLTVNEHRDYYETVEQRLDDHYAHRECAPELSDDVRAKMIELDTIIELQFYPHTPIGSYDVLHYDLDAALDIALSTFKD